MYDPPTGPYPVPVAPPKRRHTGTIAVVAILAVLLCVGGAVTTLVLAFGGMQDGFRAATAPTGPATTHTPGGKAPASTPATTGGTPTTPAATPAAATIKDGTWTAGADFPPGRYEVTSDAKFCAWQVYTGEEPNVTYVDPGHVGPGHYVFTFKAGQHLLTQGCGTWHQAG
jgi:hypothetical protein